MKTIIIFKPSDLVGIGMIELLRNEITDDTMRELTGRLKAVARYHPDQCRCGACPDYYFVPNKKLPVVKEAGVWPFEEVDDDKELQVALYPRTWSTA